MEASTKIKKYFEAIDREVKKSYDYATKARKKGYDPEDFVDVRLARDLVERVEGLVGAIAPQLVGSKLISRLRALESELGPQDWRVALKIAEEVAKEKFCRFKDKVEAMEIGIRVGFAYHTVGVVSAPLEGITSLVIKKRRDGKEYFGIKYAGPIRGAGGTGAAVSLVIADYVRKKMGYETYDPEDSEINRYITELNDYHERVTNLQYRASDHEIAFLIKNCPVEITGDPTENIEVSNYKDLDRVETNKIRGGVCLVTSMLALKAPKLWKQLAMWGEELNLEWGWLKEFLEIQKKAKAHGEGKKTHGISPDYTFIKDLVAGRPVLTHPLREGGLRLRYGRCRSSGYSAVSLNPATLHVLDNYIAIGTQLKTERPGKAASITVCDEILGPVVKLKDGSVTELELPVSKQTLKEVDKILFMGDILISYGDFFDRAHPLVPAGYCEEWYVQELKKAASEKIDSCDIKKIAGATRSPENEIKAILKRKKQFSSVTAIQISENLNVPLHPRFTYFWNSISKEEFLSFMNWLKSGKMILEGKELVKMIITNEKEGKRILEKLCVPHLLASNEYVVIERDHAISLAKQLSLFEEDSFKKAETLIQENDVLTTINKLAKLRVRDKGGTFIGARMGRPEKAKQRELTGSPHCLFPVGAQGGVRRSFQSALEAGFIEADFSNYLCSCGNKTVLSVCEKCGKKTQRVYNCTICGSMTQKECAAHGKNKAFTKTKIDIKKLLEDCMKKINMRVIPELVKGVRGTSNKEHIPEHLAKGLLRAKHKIHVNKDGTTRYDMTELPITHFKPKEIGTSLEVLKKLGYDKDINGEDLCDENQILELMPQDMILPSCSESPDEKAEDVLFRTANFVDELMEKLYGLPAFYNLKSKKDLVGCLVVGIAPHISAGIVGRIIGFSKNQGMLCSPLFHAAMRRDCDGDEACVMLLMDALINFSRSFLPDRIGARTMDSPLVLTSLLDPSEVDDMVHRLDVSWEYPLELYEAALEYKMPWDDSIKIPLLGNFLHTTKQYEGLGFTHNTSDINAGVLCSDYKLLPSMQEKLTGQMVLAEKIEAVDADDVARLVIEKHFIRDIKGNLRKFSSQQFRCVKCNSKYRRPPLIGRCTKCDNRIIFTISEGSVMKYVEPSLSLSEKYEVGDYLRQTLQLTKQHIESVFGKEKEKQEGLGRWFG